MIAFPNAKINLGLNIIEKREDGYHNLETIFYPIPIEDALEIHSLKDGNASYLLHQSGILVEGNTDDNLVIKAYRQLEKQYNLPSIEIFLHKNIPSGAGLGGGSADAAFMLKLLNAKYKLNISIEKLEEYAAALGADCAFFIRNQPIFAEGIGNIFSPINFSLKGYQIFLVKPPIFVSTRDAFALIKPHHPIKNLRQIITSPISEWHKWVKNDFEDSVFAKHPAIGALKELMYSKGALYASMSGSGSSVFGIFSPKDSLPEIDFGSETFVFKGILQ